MININPAVGALIESRHDSLLETLHDFANETVPLLATGESQSAIQMLDLELPNVVGLLDAMLLPHPAEPIAALTAMQITSMLVALERHLSMRGLWREKLLWGKSLVNYSAELGRGIYSVLYNFIGSALSEIGGDEDAIYFYKLAIEYSELEENDLELARIYGNIGVAHWNLGQLEEATIYLYLLLKAAQEHGSDHEAAMAMANIAQVLFQRGDIQDSLVSSLAALEMAEETGDVVLEAQFSAMLATHLMASELRDQAGPLFEAAAAMLTVLEDEIGLALTRLNHAVWCHLMGDNSQAHNLAIQSLNTFEQYGMAEAAQAHDLLHQLGDS